MDTYDYIIIGAGAAGLLLADALGKDAFFSEASILVLDKDAKQNNDRTWCFWEDGEGPFDAMVYKSWNHLFFGGQKFSKKFEITPYSYKMIRGIDFYKQYLERIQTYLNITFKQETVVAIKDTSDKVVVKTKDGNYEGKKILNSIFNYDMATHQTRFPVLKQHFIGWFIQTDQAVFDTDQATFMDFSIPQKGNTRFMYVLPLSKKEALLEYTLFSENLLEREEYETAIKDYINKKLGGVSFTVVEKEEGSIPMTCYDFKEHHTPNMHYIGMAGGWAKPSTGFTFRNTVKKIPKLVAHLKTGLPLNQLHFKNRFWYYDLILLDVLKKDNSMGQAIFESLFKQVKPQTILKFLDESSHIGEELQIMAAPKSAPFSKAFFKRLFKG